ncbi:MAG: ABC transporter ATP-binding protein/permease [Clostridiales bacterium]|nr:ABC transporter ATP-binding protein/permease [Clostridiales bacterium]
MKFMLSYLKKYSGMVAACIGIKFVGTILELLLPYVLEYLIDTVAPTKNMRLVALWGGVMLVLTLLVRLTNVTANRISVKSAKSAAYDIRRDLFWHSINLSGNQVDQFGLPSLTSRMTSDSYNVQNFLQSGQALGVRAPIMLVGGIAVTMTMDVGLAAILCVMAPIMLAVAIGVSLRGIPLYDKVQQSVDEIVRIMRENITGIRVVKALSKEDYERRRFATANQTMTRRDRKAGVVMALPGPLMTMALNIGLTLVVVVGAVRVNAGVTQPGVILAFLTYFNMILMGVMGLNRVFMMMSKATASAKRIQAVIDQPEGLEPLPEGEAAQPKGEGYVVFDHVSFRYGEEQGTHEGIQMALNDLNFTMKKGGSLGIIGATGSGKTTVINLLMRFYDATEGHIFVDGRDVRTYDKDSLHRKFGVVFQNDVIFAASLAENIDFGRDVDEDGIRAAAANAMAKDFIEAYDDAYQHRAAIHGANLSGGQRQRVLIARALAAHPDILVLDDSSSALDYRTDAALRKVIREEYRDTTTIVVAQRVSSIMSLDDIIMLDEGEVIGHGTHAELMASCPQYREIYQTQMGEGA